MRVNSFFVLFELSKILFVLFILNLNSFAYAQPSNSLTTQAEPGDSAYTRNLFAGVFAFLASVSVLFVICAPVRKS